MFLRNRQALFFSLFMPFIIMFIFGSIGFDKPPKIDVGIIVHNPSAQTKAFVENIKKFPTFNITEGTMQEQKNLLDKGDLSVILDIPDDLITAGSAKKEITAYVNAGKAGEAQAVVSILNQIITQRTLDAMRISPSIAIKQVEVNAHNLRYIEFLLPGLIALSVMQMAVFSVAFVFTQYKEKGVLKRLLATPMRPFQFVTANVITRLIVSILQASIFILAGVLIFKVHIIGSYPLVFLVVALGALMFLGLGFCISGIATTVDTVPALANIIVFPMLFLGGSFFPISTMPTWLQAFAKFLPLTFFSTALRDVMTKGAGFVEISHNLLFMIIWAVILITLATQAFGFQERDSA